MIRRSIAGLILGPSLLIGSLAWSGFLALRTVFDADRSRDVAEELLDNDEVRSQLTDNLGSAIEAALPAEVPLSNEQVEQVAAEVLDDPAVEELILTAFSSAHGAFLGEGNVPQTLDLTAAADALRTAVMRVAPAFESSIPDAPTLRVALPTDRIPDAGPIRGFLQTAVPIMAVVAIAGGLLALLATSDRASVLTKAGIWALSTTIFYLLLGLGVPWLLRQYAPDQAEVLAALVTALLRTTLIPSLVLGVFGAGLIAAAIMWPDTKKQQREPERPEAPRPARAAAAPRGPAWPGPVPQPLVYPEPDWSEVSGARPQSSPTPTGADPTIVKPAATAPTGPDPLVAPESPASRPAPVPERPAVRADPAPARSDLPPPLPTVSSVSQRRQPSPSDSDGPAEAADESRRIPDPSRGSSSRLPTKEQDDRPSKWRPPRWVEGHGWVMDPDDPKPPPPNASWVEGIGHVVPGPPPPKT